MKHPIRKGSGSRVYATLWAGIILVHFFVLFYFYGFSWKMSLVDSVVFNILFSIIAPGFWFIIRYARLSNGTLSVAGTHLGAAMTSVGAWTFVSNYILGSIFPDNQVYLDFLADSLVWRSILGLVFYIISALVFYLILYYQEMQERVHRELELQNLLKDSELQMLKSQINPHFIFNSLNSVSALTMSDPKSAQSMVIKLSDFLRFSLGKKSEEMNTIQQEIENVTLYLDIERVRFGEKLKFRKSVDPETLGVSVPNLILQPLIENAVKYGMYDNLDGVILELNVEDDHNDVLMVLKNNFDPSAVPSRGQGIGIPNVRRRLNLVYGPGDYLRTEKEDNQFIVSLRIPK